MPVERPKTFERMVEEIYTDAAAIMVQRHRKYSAANISRTGDIGLAVRMGDKLARYEHYVFGDKREYPDEAVDDTLLDMVNYAVIALAWRRGWWDKAGCPPLMDEDEEDDEGNDWDLPLDGPPWPICG